MSFTPEFLPDLSGKVFLVTGSNTGIGFNTVFDLAAHNAKVYLCARSVAKGRAAVEDIQSKLPDAAVSLLRMDMMDLESVKSAAQEFTSKEEFLHGLVNNAGIMATPYEESRDHYEAQFQTNYLSHWLLTHLLLPVLIKTARFSKPGDVRIVNISSDGHAFAPSAGIEFDDINQANAGALTRYGMSKLANILHAKELHRRYGPAIGPVNEGEIWVASLHPGTIETNLGAQATGSWVFQALRQVMKVLQMYSPIETAAYTSLFAVAGSEFSSDMSGEYLKPIGKLGKTSKLAMNMALAEKLWKWTEGELMKGGYIS